MTSEQIQDLLGENLTEIKEAVQGATADGKITAWEIYQIFSGIATTVVECLPAFTLSEWKEIKPGVIAFLMEDIYTPFIRPLDIPLVPDGLVDPIFDKLLPVILDIVVEQARTALGKA